MESDEIRFCLLASFEDGYPTELIELGQLEDCNNLGPRIVVRMFITEEERQQWRTAAEEACGCAGMRVELQQFEFTVAQWEHARTGIIRACEEISKDVE